MKKNHHQVAKHNSRPSAAPQLKKARNRAAVCSTSPSPSILLFLEPDGGLSEEGIDLSVAEYAALKHAAAPTGDGILMFMANAALEKVTQSGEVSLKRAAKQPSCLCFYDAGVGELAGEIPLVQHELPEAVIAAYRQRTSVDHFIADAMREKLGKTHGAETVTCVFNDPDGRVLSRVELPRDAFARIEAAASKLDITLDQFFNNAIGHYIGLRTGRRAA